MVKFVTGLGVNVAAEAEPATPAVAMKAAAARTAADFIIVDFPIAIYRLSTILTFL
ncbi:hypothetical protein [Caulobacter endophyticus]|uniref:hypothetical protein n=1 Tax=Caulobacter endophyticus TaxID=2172652 RepID=UPI001304EB6C|nr:hypothetical protein [Caulobacter endophyticus]